MAYPIPQAFEQVLRDVEHHLDLSPWVWETRHPEDEVTLGIRRLLDPDADAAMAATATSALTACLPRPLRERVAACGPLWGWTLGDYRFGPDLVLADADDVVRVVVEHKRGAPAQVTALDTVRRAGPLFYDELAHRVWKETASTSNAAPHRTASREVFDCCWAHTLPDTRTGLVRGGMWQIDAYRATPGWAAGTGLRLPGNPYEIGWVLLDVRNRAAGDVFEESVTASEWHTTGYAHLTAELLAHFFRTAHAGNPHLGDALRKLVTDGPAPRDRWLRG